MLESNLAISFKTENRLNTLSSDYTLEYLSQRNENSSSQKLAHKCSYQLYLLRVRKLEKPRCPPVCECLRKLLPAPTMECYLSTKEETIMCTSWMDLSRVMWLKRAGLKRLHIWFHLYNVQGLPWWLSGKESACQRRRLRFDPWVRKIPWRRKCQPTPVSLPEESHGQRSLTGYSPWGHKRLSNWAPTQVGTHTHTHTHQRV